MAVAGGLAEPRAPAWPVQGAGAGAGARPWRGFCCKTWILGPGRGSGGTTPLPMGAVILSRSGEVKVKVTLAPSQAATFFLSPGPWRDLERTPRVLSTETRLFPTPTHGQVHLGSPGATEPPARSRRVGRRGQDGRGPIPCRPLSAVPDSIIMNVLSSRLTQHDCIQKGWVMYGFPRDLDQAHMLDTLEYKPNR